MLIFRDLLLKPFDQMKQLAKDHAENVQIAEENKFKLSSQQYTNINQISTNEIDKRSDIKGTIRTVLKNSRNIILPIWQRLGFKNDASFKITALKCLENINNADPNNHLLSM